MKKQKDKEMTIEDINWDFSIHRGDFNLLTDETRQLRERVIKLGNVINRFIDASINLCGELKEELKKDLSEEVSEFKEIKKELKDKLF